MRWRMLAVAAALSLASPLEAADVRGGAFDDPTVVQALELLGIPRAEWPRIEVVAPGQVMDGDKQLERFAAFRMRDGGAIYVNPRHRFYLEARNGGSDQYPLMRLASVIRHELQHAQAEHGEATALAAQAKFLRQALIRIAPERRSEAMAYIQSLEKTIPAAREWDRTGEYPSVPR